MRLSNYVLYPLISLAVILIWTFHVRFIRRFGVCGPSASAKALLFRYDPFSRIPPLTIYRQWSRFLWKRCFAKQSLYPVIQTLDIVAQAASIQPKRPIEDTSETSVEVLQNTSTPRRHENRLHSPAHYARWSVPSPKPVWGPCSTPITLRIR
jgi:hypothetical protein